LLLILWNLAVYAIFVAGYVLRFGDRADPGPLRRWLLQLASGAMRWRDRGGVAAVFATDWMRHSAALYGVRAARILHAAAAALALGVIAGFYLRGIALDYQASWESTFLSPQGVHRIVRIAYAAGAAVTGIAIPSVDQIAAIRAPASENAARWLHLIAATLTVLVVVPRLALAGGRRRRRALPCTSSSHRFERSLLRAAAARVPRQRRAGVRAAVQLRASAGGPGGHRGDRRPVARKRTSILVTAPIAYGSDDPIPDTGGPSAMTIALFSAAATPERDVHGAFVDALRARGRCGAARRHQRTGDAQHRRSRRGRVASRRVARARRRIARPARRGKPGGARSGGSRRRARRCAVDGIGCAVDGNTAMSEAIALSLISHTNAGKTTLARTLLGRDVGEVRDAAHVTSESTPYPLIETPAGDALILWDTPGFGNSARLARRLAREGDPVGWFLTQVWDRFRDRALWHSQMAARTVRERADVVLYLVNATEAPADAGYLQPELDVLAWTGKPVIVLLNQTGPPRPVADEHGDEVRWQTALGSRPFVGAVITLDAFARCWVQEIALLDVIRDVLPPAKRPVFGRLAAAWHARHMARFEQAIEALAAPIARAACDREPLPEDLKATLRDVGRTLGIGSDDRDGAKARAAQALAARLAA
jgi:hypothetical protein